MRTKSATPLFCRTCGRPIKKATSEVYVYREPPRTECPETSTKIVDGKFEFVPTGRMTKIHVPRHVVAVVKTREAAARLVNERIVSVTKREDGTIDRLGVWDGETYVDDLFCTNTCAQDFGRAMANVGDRKHGTKAWFEAVAKASGKKVTS